MTSPRAVHIGQPLPGFTVVPTRAQLFCFSAVTWNPHRIHYDAPYARNAEGYPDVLVQGPLLGAFLMRMVERWVRPWGRTESMTYRSTRPVPVEEELAVGGVVVAAEDVVDAEIWLVRTSDDVRVCEGTVRAVPSAAQP